jgi:hypothetical protein
MIEFFVVVWALVLIVCIGNIIRVNKFGKFLRAEISRVSDSRLADIRNGNSPVVQWPDVQACYDNLKWYDIFNYDFKSLMVYDLAK